MRRFFLIACLSFTAGSAMASKYPIDPVPFTAVRMTGGLWLQKQAINRDVTLPFALKQCEESGRVKNFELAAETMRRRANGEPHFQIKPPTIYPFDDTDVYKGIEGAAYVLSVKADPALDRTMDEWIAKIAAAQEPDGYLYTFRTMHPDSPGHRWIAQKRWEQDPFLSHELYNVGHLYEAGVAHFSATGKRTLLDVCLKNAELLWRDFGGDRPIVAPGHQIVEVGLVKLYGVTNDARWLTLAKKFLDARGPRGPQYNQRHQLVVEQTEAVGHAVRANYMYSGMADVAALTGDARYIAAIEKIWQNVVEKKLYLTGGVGALERNEAYGGDYDLPDDGYNETCAAVGLMMWNHRMFLLSGDAKYMDVFERTAYNGFLSGVSESGDRFFYPNPLAYDGKKVFNHGYAGRAPWFGCACCPPNLMRTLASLGGYFYAVKDSALYVNLYAQTEGEAVIKGTHVKITQTTNYPWEGSIALRIAPPSPTTFTVQLRIPAWAQGRPVPSDLYTYENSPAGAWEIRVNGVPITSPKIEKGYVAVERKWQASDVVELKFDLAVHAVKGNALLASTRDRVAFERGPLVYCFEHAGNAKMMESLVVPASATTTMTFNASLLGGVETLAVEGITSSQSDTPSQLQAIPYFAWANRGMMPMSVWLRRVPLPGEVPTS